VTRAAAGATVTVVTGIVAGKTLLAVFDGPKLLHPDGRLLAELAADGHWYTEQGLQCQGLATQTPAADASPGEQARHTDEEWMAHAHDVIVAVAAAKELFTSDDIWAALDYVPHESRMIGNALSRARSAGVIAPTTKHRRSRRKENHGRPVRVWRSERHTDA
jgi:hypothetical protein